MAAIVYCKLTNQAFDVLTNKKINLLNLRTRSGSGCVLDDAEWVGGDLPTIVGGGGIRLDRDDADECFNRLGCLKSFSYIQ